MSSNFYFPLKPTRISIEAPLVSKLESDPSYILQKKKDGWRVQIYKNKDQIIIYTRHKKLLEPYIAEVDWATIKRSLADALDCEQCIVDGEFLQRRQGQKEKEKFYLWDIFEKDNKRLSLPYLERKAILSSIAAPFSNLDILEDYKGKLIDLWNSLDRSFDEGIVIKDLKEPLYVSFTKTVKSSKQFKILLDDPRNLIGDKD